MTTPNGHHRPGEDVDVETWSAEQVEYLVHDLKNPLSTMLTNLRLLEPRLADDPVARRLVADALGAAERLERMVLNLLDVGKLSAHRLALSPIAVPLEDLVEEAVVAVRPSAKARGVAVVEALDESAADLVRVDFDLMTRVLVNLLENAIRHSPEHGEVRLTVDSGESGRRLIISDQGTGVPEAWRERIFQRFVQRDAEGSDRVGRGLGLAFAKLVAEAHGVPIGVEAGESGGSRFFVGLPDA